MRSKNNINLIIIITKIIRTRCYIIYNQRLYSNYYCALESRIIDRKNRINYMFLTCNVILLT